MNNLDTDNDIWLTTMDNPYNPFTHWDDWFAFDTQAGHNTCSYVARVVDTSSELPDQQRSNDIDRAIEEILHYNLNGLYLKVDKSFDFSKLPLLTSKQLFESNETIN